MKFSPPILRGREIVVYIHDLDGNHSVTIREEPNVPVLQSGFVT